MLAIHFFEKIKYKSLFEYKLNTQRFLLREKERKASNNNGQLCLRIPPRMAQVNRLDPKMLQEPHTTTPPPHHLFEP